MPDTNSAPIRTCIATRERHRDDELLRVVFDQSQGLVVADPKRRLPGRGAWITPTLAALETAESRRAFERALRVRGPVDIGHVRNHLAELADGPNLEGKRTLMSTDDD